MLDSKLEPVAPGVSHWSMRFTLMDQEVNTVYDTFSPQHPFVHSQMTFTGDTDKLRVLLLNLMSDCKEALTAIGGA